MAYTIQAFVGAATHLGRVQLPEAVRRPLAGGQVLIPFTNRFREVHGIPSLPLTDDRGAPEAILRLGAAASRGGMIAYVEAEYFGGAGAQAAIVWRDGQVVSGPSVGPGAIDDALRLLGVARTEDEDEFAVVGLGRHRFTEDWAMPLHHPILAIPAKPDVERDAVAAAWEGEGGQVIRVDRFWQPPAVDPAQVALYGNDTFCLVLAQVLGLQLMSPPDDLLLQAGAELTKRAVAGGTLSVAATGTFPAFIKPLVPKAFRAAVWKSADDLRLETAGLSDDTPVIVSEPVCITAEARAWVLDGEVVTCAVYEGAGACTEASTFLGTVARRVSLPPPACWTPRSSRGAAGRCWRRTPPGAPG